MFIAVTIFLLITAGIFLFLRHPKFGSVPRGERLSRILQSPNYKEGKFQNQSVTPQLAEGYKISGVIYSQLFKRVARRRPKAGIPAIRTDIKEITSDNYLVWFGHSSYFLELMGIKILVDPVFSNNASPIPGTNKPFNGSNIYTAEDMPAIDFLLITHDHYDHLDYETILRLKGKVKKVICGLGVGSHLVAWGYAEEQIVECDWNEELTWQNGLKMICLPARHFSGRGFTRNNTLWVSFLLVTPTIKVYAGGDSGYDSHVADIGNKYGPIDLAILDNGQYNAAWCYIHSLPAQVLQGARDLRAKSLFPVHSCKFTMANHAWDEPLMKIAELNADNGVCLVTPKIGEVVYLPDKKIWDRWWESVEAKDMSNGNRATDKDS